MIPLLTPSEARIRLSRGKYVDVQVFDKAYECVLDDEQVVGLEFGDAWLTVAIASVRDDSSLTHYCFPLSSVSEVRVTSWEDEG